MSYESEPRDDPKGLQMPETAKIVEALESTRKIVTDLNERTRDIELLVRDIQNQLGGVVSVTNKLQTLVWTGNGTDSLMTRVAIMEKSVAAIAEGLKSLEGEKQKVKTSMIVSLLALVGTLASTIFKLVTK